MLYAFIYSCTEPGTLTLIFVAFGFFIAFVLFLTVLFLPPNYKWCETETSALEQFLKIQNLNCVFPHLSPTCKGRLLILMALFLDKMCRIERKTHEYEATFLFFSPPWCDRMCLCDSLYLFLGFSGSSKRYSTHLLLTWYFCGGAWELLFPPMTSCKKILFIHSDPYLSKLIILRLT